MIWQWSLTVALMLVGVVVWAWLSGALNDPEKETERDDARWETERYWKAREEQRAKEKRAQELNEVLDERQHRKNKGEAAKDAVNDHSGFNKAVRAIVDKVLEEREASTHVVEPEPLPHCPRCHKQREWAEPCAECGWEPWRWETKRDATT